MKVKNISKKGIALLEKVEGLRLKAYLDTAGVWTLGIGTTRYPSGPHKGERVMPGQTCTEAQAYEWCALDLVGFCKWVDDLTTDALTQNMFDALSSFVYNLGPTNYKGSTLRKKINANPKDPTIRDEFLRWNKSGGKVTKGLTIRRKAEADLYFS